MRQGLLGALVLTPLALGAVGCNNGPEPIELGDLTTRIGAAYCDYAARCGTQTALVVGLLHTSVSSCGSQTATYLANTQFARYQEAIDQGTLAYDANQAATCLSSFQSLSCDPTALSGAPAGCDATFTGLVADGGACSLDEECHSGSTCVTSGTGCGVCTRTPAIGQPCTSACARGAYCNGGTCAAQVAAGGACTAPGACVVGTSCTSGTCQAPTLGAAGMPCGTGGCQTGLVCAFSGAMTMCRAPRTDGTCQGLLTGSDCPANQICSAGVGMDGTCGPYPLLGDACTTACSAPARCVAHVCHESVQLGETCAGNDDCISGVCDGTCQAPPLCAP